MIPLAESKYLNACPAFFSPMGKEEVLHFYQKSWPLIVRLLQADTTYCIHHGYYEKGIRSHVQSVQNMNDFIGRLLHLDSNENHARHILDAGCGIGGTVIHLAQRHPQMYFTGITIIPEHIAFAQKLAQENHVGPNTDFHLADFLDTDFPPNRFDAIYLIESASYARDKRLLLREMHRILKPGGSIVIIDCFRTSVPLNQFLQIFYNWFCQSWELPGLISVNECERLFAAEGFQSVTTIDMTKNVIRTILRCDVLSIPYVFPILFRRVTHGNAYKIADDPAFLAMASLSSTVLGLKKGISYNAIIGMK
jgi:ubiquinone/menaquinone biosynthesis C-methylase UbiE